MTPETLILIANASRARLCTQHGRAGACRTVHTFAHPRSAAHGRELVTDRPGRVPQRIGSGSRSAAEPHSPPKRLEAAHFARELAAHLATALREDATAQLILVAPPRFLGLLREELDEPLRARVADSVAADLTSVAETDLPARLAALRDQA